jgi:hypothetical protein
MASVSAPFRDAAGTEIATLTVNQLLARNDRLELVDEQIVLEEEATYAFQLSLASGLGAFSLTPHRELFSFDEPKRGRLQPQRHVGHIRLRLRSGSTSGELTLSVRPRKLVEDEYRQMLDDLAQVATEVILQAFAPPSVTLRADATTQARLLYQQFAFLHARLMSSGEDDIMLVLNRPHSAWVEDLEPQPANTALRGGSGSLRALSRPGARLRTPNHPSLPSVPRHVRVPRSAETLDTEPNRFVAFALRRWRQLAQDVLDALTDQRRQSAPIIRGIDEAKDVIASLDRALSNPLFRDVGALTTLPTANQVLQKRAGYRELFRTFVLVEAGARIALEWDIDDLFNPSQRNIATLYEYWSFLQLVNVVGEVCDGHRPAAPLQVSPDGMTMRFPGGKASRMVWTTNVRGRDLTVELFFNRRFMAASGVSTSWTEQMHPDCSLLVRPAAVHPDVSSDELAVWLHFDAKYRVQARTSVAEHTRQRRDDMLKMHAYRDAIRRSAGAYVLYPGTADVQFVEHHEILPGLGAFVLRPQRNGANGTAVLEQFVRDVLDHVANSASQHERSRYWQARIYRHRPSAEQPARPLPAMAQPPADAMVLLGYVRDDEHWAWITEEGLYNVRAGHRRGAVGPEADALQAPDLVLYGPGRTPSLWSRRDAWFVQTQENLTALGYPEPRGDVYLCCAIERRDDEPVWLASVAVSAGTLAPAISGAPVVRSWSDLLEASYGS